MSKLRWPLICVLVIAIVAIQYFRNANPFTDEYAAIRAAAVADSVTDRDLLDMSEQFRAFAQTVVDDTANEFKTTDDVFTKFQAYQRSMTGQQKPYSERYPTLTQATGQLAINQLGVSDTNSKRLTDPLGGGKTVKQRLVELFRGIGDALGSLRG